MQSWLDARISSSWWGASWKALKRSSFIALTYVCDVFVDGVVPR